MRRCKFKTTCEMSNRIISKVICLKKSRFEFVVEGQLTFYILKEKNFTLFLNDYNWTKHTYSWKDGSSDCYIYSRVQAKKSFSLSNTIQCFETVLVVSSFFQWQFAIILHANVHLWNCLTIENHSIYTSRKCHLQYRLGFLIFVK